MVMMTEGLSRLTPERRRRRRRPLFRRHQRLLARPAMFVLPFDKHKKTQAACVTYCLPPSVPRCLPESDTMALVRVSEPHARFACGETVRPPPNGIWPLEARRRTEEAHRATMLQRRLRPSWLGDREREEVETFVTSPLRSVLSFLLAACGFLADHQASERAGTPNLNTLKNCGA